MLTHHGHCVLGGAGSSLGGREISTIEHAGQSEAEKGLSLLDRDSKRLGVTCGEIRRIDACGHLGDGHVDLEAPLPFVDALGRGLACRIGVERQHDAATESLEHADVVFGQRRSTGGNGPADADVGEADDVGVALADDRFVLAYDLVLCQVQPVEQPALRVDRRVEGVLVLRAFGPRQDPSPEADSDTVDVVDREQDPGPEVVLDTVGAVHEPETGCDERLLLDPQRLIELVPVVGCPTDLVGTNLLPVEAPRS